MLVINALGGLSISLDGEILKDFGSHKAQALLVYLAIEERPIQREVLAGIFWPENSQAKALVSLRVELSVLRKILRPFIEITRDTVNIKPDANIYLDTQDLDRKINRGEIESALALFKGDFLAGFKVLNSAPFEEWQLAEQRRVRNLVSKALHEAVLRAIDTKDVAFGLKLVCRLLEMEPLDEQAHQQCMLLHVMRGDRNAAVAQYKKCAAILQDELCIEPLENTQKLYENILHGREPRDYESQYPMHNLPAQQTSFVGRKAELYQISKLIHKPNCRLVTLVGPGGSGKTRLGIEVAKLILNAFPDGIYFIPCEGCLNAGFLIHAIANVLKFNIDTIATQLDPEIQLIDYLHGRVLLFILDGFDALVPEAERLSKMLERVPGLKLLITSRQPLNLKGEWLFEVKGLPVSAENEQITSDKIEAVQLFMDRAKQSNIGFSPSHPTYQSIAHICQLVEGMPLGIELAAAWTSILPIDDIKIEVENNLDFLKSDNRDAPDKHQSIRAVFDGSWNLLSGDQRQDLCKLSVFQGSFNRKSAFEVTKLDLPHLASLVGKSLVYSDHAGRFRMHQLVKQFAFEQLQQNPAIHTEVQNRYCQYYTDFLTQHETDLMGSKMLAARAEICNELHHIYASVQWVSSRWRVESVQKILTSFNVFFAVHGWHEGIDAFENIINLKKVAITNAKCSDQSADPVILICRAHQAFLLSNLGQIDESEVISSACLEPLNKFGLDAELSECMHNLGVNASFRGEYETARSFLEEAILLGRDCDHVIWPTYLLWLGHVYFLLGEYEQGLITLKKCRDVFMEKGTLWGAAFAISKMGLAADGLGEHEQALGYHQDALNVFNEIENKAGKGYSLSRMSMSTCFLSHYDQALKLGEEALELFTELGHRWGISSSLSRLGFAYIGLGSTDIAREMFIEALRLSKQNQMAPLSLYALAGLACNMMHEGQEKPALELFSYVIQHPKAPKAYLDQALCLMTESERISLENECHLEGGDRESQPVEEVINHYLYTSKNNIL
ncbi:MAG: BTAD domain-containing putative transcriptional regulator [Chloroflexota bacterium]|nr:BTAD domain-containing putative transcriptional regulator [Chloroflexota bacterium]